MRPQTADQSISLAGRVAGVRVRSSTRRRSELWKSKF